MTITLAGTLLVLACICFAFMLASVGVAIFAGRQEDTVEENVDWLIRGLVGIFIFGLAGAVLLSVATHL